MSNWAAARMIGSDNLLRDTILTAVISGYAVRNGSAAGEASLHNMSLQLMSSFTTVLAVLGVVSAVSDKIPYLSGQALFVGMLGLASFHIMGEYTEAFFVVCLCDVIPCCGFLTCGSSSCKLFIPLRSYA